MLKKGLDSGVIYFLIAIVFAIGAISKTISSDSIILAMQWLCAVVLVILGILRLRKNTVG
ncbi:MAG: hypothetical protein IPP66_22430 [Anaerolineales bacterium]|nr:hypothetical protein [Anaerolineales bacterium]